MTANTLKAYAQFLLDNHLEEMTVLSIQRAKEIKLPLLALFTHYSDEELLAFSQQSVQKFLIDLTQGLAFESHVASLERWKKDLISEVPSSKVNARDLAFSSHIRKYALYKLLSQYTNDISVYQSITQEIECFYSEHQSSSLEAFMEIQNQAIQREKDFLQTIIDHTEDGISAFDQQGRITLWNKALEQRTGVTRQQMLGSNPFERFPDYKQTEDWQGMAKALQGEKTSLLDRPYQEREGYYEALIVPLLNQQKEVFGALTVSRDITQRRVAQMEVERGNQELAAALEELRSSQEQLVELNSQLERRIQERTDELQASLEELRASNETLILTQEQLEEANGELVNRNTQLLRINTDLDNFVYTASHDLKSPVSNLEGLMKVLQRKILARLDSTEVQVLDMMGNAILKLKETISGLIEITKAAKSYEEVETVVLPTLVEEVKEQLHEWIQSADATIKEAYQVPAVQFARAHVRSVIYNLLSNAIKYRSLERPLEIGISTITEEGYLILCIEDNGLGLTEVQQTKLFTMFKRIHTHVEGTGIGLYIIKRVMENAGGKIQVQSQIGQGSQFRVYFPLNGVGK